MSGLKFDDEMRTMLKGGTREGEKAIAQEAVKVAANRQALREQELNTQKALQ